MTENGSGGGLFKWCMEVTEVKEKSLLKMMKNLIWVGYML